MSTAVNTGRKAAARRRTKTTTQAAAAQYKIAIKYILCGALLLLGIVFMAAYSTNLQQQNNTLAARNDVLQAEIDSLNEQINDATSIEKVETIATKKYGMVQPDESNYITIRDEKKQGSSLADTIKKEAYN
ncbi:septum formation initiator family protein [Mogibacterium kristiansenii]|uniref:septum formation initiator family protein n=1 Tax=Mogibacterium kristiansenii TaxID=2606708 RepID=UPI002409EF64|nr:septum formation initiator family protein [Mogibacterium kristiansenii]MDD6700107.1 septum formation initiator family protein [Mogibacterium kristiansenii]